MNEVSRFPNRIAGFAARYSNPLLPLVHVPSNYFSHRFVLHSTGDRKRSAISESGAPLNEPSDNISDPGWIESIRL